MPNMPIGIFDSGLGGLTILKEITNLLPDYEYIYLGDNARSPYGDRSPERIYEFTKQGVEELFRRGCALVILACNTASARALRRLQQDWLPATYPDRRVLGIIIPVVEHVLTLPASRQTCIGIIGTRETILSLAYEKEFEKQHYSHEIITTACPLLVPLIEEGLHLSTPGIMMLKKYLRPLKLKQVSIVILGCTHYNLLKEKIVRIMGARVRVIDSGSLVAQSLKQYLIRHQEIEKQLSKNKCITFLTTDAPSRISELAVRFWKSPIHFKQITLE